MLFLIPVFSEDRYALDGALGNPNAMRAMMSLWISLAPAANLPGNDMR